MNKKRLFQILQVALTILLIGFIAFKFEDFFSRVDWSLVVEKWPFVVFSSFVFTLGYWLMAQHWQRVCEVVDGSAQKRQWLAFFASQPYKYLPTSIFTFSFRAVYAGKLGMSFKRSSEAQVIENINLIGTSIFIGLFLLSLLFSWIFAVLLGAAGSLLLVLLWKLRFFNIPKLHIRINLREWLKTLPLVVGGWIFMGCGFYIVSSVIDNVFSPISAVAANSLATGVGILAIFAPGGIGVRELVFSLFFYTSTSIIIWRLVTFLVDIAIGVVAIWAIARSRK